MNYYEVQLHFSAKWASPDPYEDCYNIDHSQKEAYCPICGRGVTASKWGRAVLSLYPISEAGGCFVVWIPAIYGQ
jgi:hypothetical protein